MGTRHKQDALAILAIPPAEIMDMPLRPLFTTLLLVTSLVAQAATEVVPLQHRASAELLPAAQAFIGKDGTVSAFENKLIVNASPERIDDLRALLPGCADPATGITLADLQASQDRESTVAVTGKFWMKVIKALARWRWRA